MFAACASWANRSRNPRLRLLSEVMTESACSRLDYIFNTHHHYDHTGGNEELKAKYGCQVIGPKADEGRIPGIDIALDEGETFQFGDLSMHCYNTPGHTRGHVSFHIPQADALFPGEQCALSSLSQSSSCCLLSEVFQFPVNSNNSWMPWLGSHVAASSRTLYEQGRAADSEHCRRYPVCAGLRALV